MIEKTPFRSLYKPIHWLIQSKKLNQALLTLHKNCNVNVTQYASYTATALFAPTHIPSVSRISSYQPLWDAAYEKNPSIQNILCDFLELRALKKTKLTYGPSKLIGEIIENKINREVEIIETPLSPKSPIDETKYIEYLSGKKYILFFGTLGVLKGVLEIAKILPNLFTQNQNIHFVFAGKDTIYNGKSIIETIKNHASKYEDRCIFLGSLKKVQLTPVVQNAEVVVLPSRVDNLPNTCIEAMSLGKIVIGTQGASFEQLITDGENGFLCDIQNSESLYSKIEEALNLTEFQKNKMSEKAIQRTKKLEPEVICDQLLNLYNKAINKH